MSKIKKFFSRNVFPILFYFLPIQKRKVVFSSYAGSQYSDNPRAISEKLHENYPNYDIVWLFNSKETIKLLPNYVRVVENESCAAAYELYTSGIWVDNIRKPVFFPKRKDQIYIQCWHGTPLKLIESDAGDTLSAKYMKYSARDTKNMTYLISGNRYSSEIFRRAFNYTGEILEIGTPRNDVLISDNNLIAQKVRKKLEIRDKKVILFAPTFRNDIKKNGYPQIEQLNPKSVLDAFEEKFGEKCVLLLRFHPNVAEKVNRNDILNKYKGRVLDVSVNWNMQELLCAADVLITDYSSVFLDFSILGRPIFLFVPDKEDYNKERGLYLNIQDLPVCSAKSTDELIRHIRNEDLDNLQNRTKKLLELIGNAETGEATKKMVEIMVKHMQR